MTKTTNEIPRERMQRFAGLISELGRRQQVEGCEGSLLEFVRQFWPILEPETKLVEGWPLEAMCAHLEAITRGEIRRLLINISPGSMKSLLTNVFWPAWEWGPKKLAHKRYVTFSYAAHLTERDNGRFRALMTSEDYRAKFGDRFKLRKVGEFLVSNDKMGWKIASSVGGISTGERGDTVILDDPHNVKQGESSIMRTGTVEWFANAMSNRLNDLEKSAIVVVMQRLHEDDVAGFILARDLGYEHLCIPAEYEEGRHCATGIGWTDPRSKEGENFWPARFPGKALDDAKSLMGPYGFASQYQQRPEPKGGAIFLRDWWQYMPTRGDRLLPLGIGFDYIVASLDTAYTAKEQNDYSALSVWGSWRDGHGDPKVMLIDCWQKRLEIHGAGTDRDKGETDESWLERKRDSWGLTEWVAFTCRRHRVHRLLIESKAAGISVAQELRRLYGREGFSIDLVNPRGDKVARAHSVVPLFSDGYVYIPAIIEGDEMYPVDHAEMLMSQAAYFPRGSHDDLVDSMVHALRHMRDYGFAVRSEENRIDYEESMVYKPKPPPLYEC